MENKKYCCTCRHYTTFEGVCINGDSEYRADFRGLDDTCEKWAPIEIQFFMAMIPPTCTHQEKQVHVVNGKPVFYEPKDLQTAREKLKAHLGKNVPSERFTGTVRLTTWWCFPINGKHKDGEYKTSKPDTDNLVKMLKDVMTELHFWNDDAQVASEVIEKFWAEIPGIFVKVEAL